METETKEPEVKEVVQEQNNTAVDNQQEENPQERNWRAFREQRELERKQREEEKKQREAAEKLAMQKAQEAEALKAALEAAVSKPVYPYQQQLEEDISDDDRIQKKIEAALSARERQLEDQRRQREQQEMPTKLVQTFPDFEKVCTVENLDYIEYHYPEVASAFKHVPEGFDKWASIYKAVKRFVPNPESKRDQVKAERNLTKPQSMAAPGVTSTGDNPPYQLDEKKRADNWARMQRVMKGLS